MALINCPKCGKQISELSKECLQCGFPIYSSEQLIEEVKTIKGSSKAEPRKRKKVLITISIILGLITIVAAIVLYWFSISPSGLLSLIDNKTKSIGSSDSIVESKVTDEWSSKNIPLDIMNRIEVGMNVSLLKGKLGEPQKVGEFDNQEFTWNCDCIDITVNSKDGRIESIKYQYNECDNPKYYLYTGIGDTIYLGKSTFKTFKDDYNFEVSYNIQGSPAYFQMKMGNSSNDFTNYLFEAVVGVGIINDIDMQGKDSVTLDKLPSDLQKEIITDAKNTVIEKVTITKGM